MHEEACETSNERPARVRLDRAYRYEIRAAERARDLTRMVEIESACFPEELAYTRKELYHFLRAPNAASMTAVDRESGATAGFVIISWRKGCKVGYVQTIDVAPEHRGNGLGRFLLETAERAMAERGLTKSILQVYLRNSSALKLYLEEGYTIRRVRTRYYANSYKGARDALELVKDLTPLAPTRLTAPAAVAEPAPQPATARGSPLAGAAIAAALGGPRAAGVPSASAAGEMAETGRRSAPGAP